MATPSFIARRRDAAWVALVLAGAAVLYLRPHEDVLGGMDHGAYLHSGMAFLRARAFEHVDPLLSRVPPADRALFLYRSRPFRKMRIAGVSGGGVDYPPC